jgi:leucyl aminopeptidase
MEFRYVSGALSSIKADLLVLSVFGELEGDAVFEEIDAALGGLLSDIASECRFKGKAGQSIVARTGGAIAAKQVAVLGLGLESSFAVADQRNHGSQAAITGGHVGAKHVAMVLPRVSPAQLARVAQSSIEGVLLGNYQFNKYQTRNHETHPISRFSVVLPQNGKAKAKAAQTRTLKDAVTRGEVIAQAVCRARDLVNEPAGHLTPTQMAEEARIVAKEFGLGIKVLGRKECERLGMGMFLGVARGSVQEPKFIHLTYKPKGKVKSKVALVGKGVMFDSGGYSLKPSAAMEDMKIDMAGAAAVISSMACIAKLGSKHEVHAIAACCENLVSGDAYKLGDVLKAMDGTTVEINNTDAEGRLTLGDAITYARTKVKPDEIFDFATLTGACMVALGPYTAGVMSDSDEVVGRWLAAAERAGEDMWRLPLNKRLKDQLKSHVADMRNTGERFGGAITAGLFLQNFAKDASWVHVDIAGPASTSKRKTPTTPRGGTGFAVASIVEYLTGDS